LDRCPQEKLKVERIWEAIHKLRTSVHFGYDPDILESYDQMPETLKREWVNHIYSNTDCFDFSIKHSF